MAVCSEIHTKHINTLCGQNVELLNVKLVVHIVTTGLWGIKNKGGNCFKIRIYFIILVRSWRLISCSEILSQFCDFKNRKPPFPILAAAYTRCQYRLSQYMWSNRRHVTSAHVGTVYGRYCTQSSAAVNSPVGHSSHNVGPSSSLNRTRSPPLLWERAVLYKYLSVFKWIIQPDASINYRFIACRSNTAQHISGILMPETCWAVFERQAINL